MRNHHQDISRNGFRGAFGRAQPSCRSTGGGRGGGFTELGFAEAVTRWQQDETGNAPALGVALRYAAWASHTAEGRAHLLPGPGDQGAELNSNVPAPTR